jgi:hypothetical protein
MYTAIKADVLKDVLKLNDIHYGDIFYLVYKDTNQAVGYMHLGLPKIIYEDKPLLFSYMPGGKLWLVDKDGKDYEIVDYYTETQIRLEDPYFKQRILTLIMTKSVEIKLKHRWPKRSLVQRIMTRLAGLKSCIGDSIK